MATEARTGEGFASQHLEARAGRSTDAFGEPSVLAAPGEARQTPHKEEHYAECHERAAEEQDEAAHLVERSVDYLGYAHAVLVVDLDDLATCDDHVVVRDDVDGRADLAVELDHLSDAELQYGPNGQPRAADAGADLEGDIAQAGRLFATRRRRGSSPHRPRPTGTITSFTIV